ncbi:MAG: toxin TcdB middle/N-terminal domain-containing protein, partial [Polyangiaceae bacterium]|nr:toxin TcdB middle/N-terminal domain-containing protein [Polyangiaceae bacterium]
MSGLHWPNKLQGSKARPLTPFAFAAIGLSALLGVVHPRLLQAQSATGNEASPSSPPTEGAAIGEYNESTNAALAEKFKGASTEAPPADTSAPAPTSSDASKPPPPATTDKDKKPEALPGLTDVQKALAALPKGGAAIASQAISLPKGAGSVEGMGESFSAQLSTGVATFSVPFHLPKARGGAQPELGLSYNSGDGFGDAGMGWSVGAPSIDRQTDRGAPSYDDRADWHAEQDHFRFGSTELVPICTVASTNTCAGAPTETFIGYAGWQYFRPRMEGSFSRFFWSWDHKTWVVQSKDGLVMEFGVPRDGTGDNNALEFNPDKPSEISSWQLVRAYDTHFTTNPVGWVFPLNVVVYRYLRDGGTLYLSHIYDTPPASAPTTTDLSTYAHHTALSYSPRPDSVVSYRTGWATQRSLRLTGVDVTSKPFVVAAGAQRTLVRRYHLGYDPSTHTSLLTSVQVEGRCGEVPENALDAGGNPIVAQSTNCARLPPLKLDYERVSGAAPLRDSQGFNFEPFNTSVRDLGKSPPHSLDETLTELMDINSDGLPDVVVTAPGLYGGAFALFENGLASDGSRGFRDLKTMGVIPNLGVDSNVLQLSNTNVTPLDVDGDGRINLVHMPQVKQYSIFSPLWQQNKWVWAGRKVDTAGAQNAKIDFTRDAANLRVMDVNGDGLVDVVFSGATEWQTFLALGRYPGGDGQFGQAKWTGADTASISLEPIRTCAPWASTPVRFSDPDVKVADMNGDGLDDIVRVRSEQIQYWPGRGNGVFGTGSRSDCTAGSVSPSRAIGMATAPTFGVADAQDLMLNDVNGDGLADLVEVRFDAVDIYLNDNGLKWTSRVTISGTPQLPNAAHFARLTDIDGSGTPDILWGQAYQYRYIDLAGGKRPYVLTSISNGLGSNTELQYSTSTQVMLDAEKAGNKWSSQAPSVVPVVTRSTVYDNLQTIGRPGGAYVTEYVYRDPVYDGRDREFRGFSQADSRKLGDPVAQTDLPAKTAIQRSTFLLGECPSSDTALCAPENRWKDNWRAALKGLPVLVETLDAGGAYLSTQHTSYELRPIYTGRDGRNVVAALPRTVDSYLYDNSPFTPAPASNVVLEDVVYLTPSFVRPAETRTVARRATTGTAHTRAHQFFDAVGNQIESRNEGCIEGCALGTEETISQFATYELVAGSDWLWRKSREYVTGSAHAGNRKDTTTTYLPTGEVYQVKATLSGTLALDRFHTNATATLAPAPTGAAADGEFVASTNAYDSFGNLVSTTGIDGRCRSITYDSDFAQLPLSETTFAGAVAQNGCGAFPLTTDGVVYDRGMELILEAKSLTKQPSRFVYDSFGRITEIYSVDPATPGVLGSLPTTKIQYFLPSEASLGTTPYSAVQVLTQDGATPAVNSYAETWSFTDGLGRTLLSLTLDDALSQKYIQSGVTIYNGHGSPKRAYENRYVAVDPSSLLSNTIASRAVLSTPTTLASKSSLFDAFDRVVASYGLDGAQNLRTDYHALSQDLWDAADLGSGLSGDSFATATKDGHGRPIITTERVNRPVKEERLTITSYLPTGEPEVITRRRQGSPDVVRWMRYDSLGRMVLNVEPNTSKNFDPNPAANVGPGSTLKAWRYAYNRAGDIVGTSDARGCGVNYTYDAAGRLTSEDYSPCVNGVHAAYSTPVFTAGSEAGIEILYRYDTPDPDDGSSIQGANNPWNTPSLLLGKMVSVSDRASKTVTRYDARDRVTGVAVRVTKNGAASSVNSSINNRYAPRWYTRTFTLDAANRIVSQSTGATLPDLTVNGQSNLTYVYGKSGRIQSIGSSYGTLLQSAEYAADGLPIKLTMGDAAATQRSYFYDSRRRLATVGTERAVPQLWSSLPAQTPDEPTQQLPLEDLSYAYDEVDNPTSITDNRNPADWPASAQPVDRTFAYDDLYRLVLTQNTYKNSATWKSPLAPELPPPPATATAAAQTSFSERIGSQSYNYDWLGNTQSSDDNLHGFYDRSLGTITNGTAAGGTTKFPYRLTAASNRTITTTTKGDLGAAYDDAGNLTGLLVKRDGPCLPAPEAPALSACWQRFDYQWDEVGQLKKARRWDLTSKHTPTLSVTASPSTGALSSTPAVALTYAYNSGGQRVIKTSTANATTNHTLYIFDSLELRGTEWLSGEYGLDSTTASVRLLAGPVTARVALSAAAVPT